MLRVLERGRGLMFNDFRSLVESPGFAGLVRSLGRSALALTVVERVTRKSGVGVTHVMTSKQRETAEDNVVTDLHIGMVSFDFCPGETLSVPFVSYGLHDDAFVAKTPMADKFLHMMLEFTGIFANRQQLFGHIKEQFCPARRSGTTFLFSKLHIVPQLTQSDLLIDGESLVENLER
jgi:hypothetical protein